MIETIELDFDVSLNTMMIRYSQLQSAYKHLTDSALDNAVRLFLLDNLRAELDHIRLILNKEIPNEIKARENAATG